VLHDLGDCWRAKAISHKLVERAERENFMMDSLESWLIVIILLATIG